MYSLAESLLFAQIVEKYHGFHESQRIIMMYMRAHPWFPSCARRFQLHSQTIFLQYPSMFGSLKVVPSFQVFRLKFCEHFYEPTIWHSSSPLLSRLSFPIFPEESWSVHILPLKGKRPSFTLVRLQVLAATNVMINRVFWGVPRSVLLPPPRP